MVNKRQQRQKDDPKVCDLAYVHFLINLIIVMSRGGRGQVVNVLAFKSNSPSSNPTV